MTLLPVTLILVAAAALGTVLLMRHLQGRARRPVMIGAHLILSWRF